MHNMEAMKDENILFVVLVCNNKFNQFFFLLPTYIITTATLTKKSFSKSFSTETFTLS